MAKPKKRRSKQMTVPLSIVGGLGAGLAEPIMWAMGGDYDAAIYKLMENYTGYDIRTQRWDLKHARGIPPLIIGALIHKFVGGSPLNINRTLARAGIPFIRI